MNWKKSQPIGKNGRRTPWGGHIGGFDNFFREEPNSTTFASFNDSAEVTYNDLADGHNIIVPKLLFSNRESDLHLPKINKMSSSMEA